MIDTYQAGENGLEIKEYQRLATGEMAGWTLELAQWEGRPFLLLRAKSWKGRQPRFALTHGEDGFLQTLRDLAVLGRLRREKAQVKLVAEEPILIESGLHPLPTHYAEASRLWAELTTGQNQ